MLFRIKILLQTVSQDEDSDEDEVRKAWKIEKILNRAHEIHRSGGGLFGYDLEDWLEAERELREKSKPRDFRIGET